MKNQSNSVRRLFGRVIATVVAATIAGSTTLAAQQPSGAPPREGIKVHGDWTIEVREPNGTLVKRHEIKNGLVETGELTIAYLLSRIGVAGRWAIWLSGSAGRQPCGTTCEIYEDSPNRVPTEHIFENLSVTTSGASVVLSGQATASGTNPEILAVMSFLGRCSSGEPGPCLQDTIPFSHQILKDPDTQEPEPISLSPGQIIQVRVVFTFS